jgi:hypothetical protein
LDFLEINSEGTNGIILSEFVLVHEVNDSSGFARGRNSDAIIPVRVFASLVADLALDSDVAYVESTVGVHLANQISIMSEIGFNGFENKSSGH